MKSFVIRNTDNSTFVEYMTDHIDGCENLTIYQVKNLNNTDTERAFPFEIAPYSVQTLVDFAVDNGYILEAYETGSEKVTLVDIYGDTGAIGEGEL